MNNKALVFTSLFSLLFITGCGGNHEEHPSPSSLTQAAPPAAAPTDVAVVLPEPRKNYTLVHSSSSILVKHNTTGVSATHANVTHIRFSDVSVNLMVAQNAKTIAGKDLNSLIDLYIAFFNRVPDADGLNYWINNFKAGATLEEIGANFYRVAKQYPDVTGYDEKMNDEAFVRLVYKNVLGRIGSTAPPESHVAYWVKDLQNGLSKERLVAVMLVAAREYANDKEWAWMTTLLNNKVALGKYFALEQGLTYLTYEDSIRKTVALTAAVTPTDYLKAKNLIEVGDREFNLQISSSSGIGRMLDCFNPALYTVGNTILFEEIETEMKRGADGTFTAEQTTFEEASQVTGPVNFKGNSVLALIGTRITRHSGRPDSVESVTAYLNVGKDGYISYGDVDENYVPGTNQKIYTLNYTSPAYIVPFTLAINETFVQSFVNYQENFLTGEPIRQDQRSQRSTFLGIEDLTVPAGSFSACKIKSSYSTGQSDDFIYIWYIASGPYRGMRVKILGTDGWMFEASKLAINGK